MRKILIFSIILALVAVPLVTITVGSAAQAGYSVPACEFSPKSGRTIVYFSEYIRSDAGEMEASGGAYDVWIPEGNYRVSLMSYDNHSDEKYNMQPNEEWYLIMGDKWGGDLGITNSISDLPDHRNTLSEQVNSSFYLDGDAAWIVVFHAAYGNTNTYSSNRVRPVCAAFDRISHTAPVPTVHIEANDFDGSITIPYNSSARIDWSSSDATSCSISPSGWTGIWGSYSLSNLTYSRTYTVSCWGPGGSASDSVTVNVDSLIIKPIAISSAATNVAQTSAQLNGVALPGQHMYTHGWFEWGTSANLGKNTYQKGVGSTYSLAFSEVIYDLKPNTLYYYRAVVENPNGKAYGNTLTFRTTGAAPVYPKPVPYPKPAPTPASVKSLTIGKVVAGAKEATVAGGSNIEYSLIVKNAGNLTLANVSVSDTLSEHVEFVSATDGGKYDDKTKKVTWSLGSLNVGVSKTVKVVAKAKASKDAVVASGSATAKADGLTAKSSNDVKVKINPSAMTLPIFSISNPGDIVQAGDTVDYSVRFENTSGVEMKDVKIRVILPDALKYNNDNSDIKQSGNTLTWNIGNMPVGQERVTSFSTEVKDDARNGDSVGVTGMAEYGEANSRQQIVTSSFSTIEGGSDKDNGKASAFFSNIPFFDGTLGKVISWLVIIILTLLLILLGLWTYDRIVERRINR